MKVYHAQNWAEVGILIPGNRTVYVDGFVSGDGRDIPLKSVLRQACQGDTVLEFEGCFAHACPVCFPYGRDVVKCARTGRTYNEVYYESVQRSQSLIKMGFNVVIMWEHEFRKLIKDQQDVKSFVDRLPPPVGLLDPRDSFYGGHTDLFNLLYDRVDSAMDVDYPDVEYVDFTSLYPAVQKQFIFPLGHPEVLTFDLKPQDIFHYFGIIKATVLPLINMLHPVLPFRTGGKLMFPLCRTCAETKSRSCNCTPEERSILGTWVSPELQYAVRKGYRIIHIHEVYHYKHTTANTIDEYTGKPVDLFGGYVNLFLKIKTESSGWPDGVESEEEKQAYICDFEAVEGV